MVDHLGASWHAVARVIPGSSFPRTTPRGGLVLIHEIAEVLGVAVDPPAARASRSRCPAVTIPAATTVVMQTVATHPSHAQEKSGRVRAGAASSHLIIRWTTARG